MEVIMMMNNRMTIDKNLVNQVTPKKSSYVRDQMICLKSDINSCDKEDSLLYLNNITNTHEYFRNYMVGINKEKTNKIWR